MRQGVGVGLLLLPLMWLSYLALAALPTVLCLAGAAGVVVAWAPEGIRPDLRAVVGAVAGGPLAASATAIGCALVWAVAALITYAQARRGGEPLTSAQLRAELAV